MIKTTTPDNACHKFLVDSLDPEFPTVEVILIQETRLLSSLMPRTAKILTQGIKEKIWAVSFAIEITDILTFNVFTLYLKTIST